MVRGDCDPARPPRAGNDTGLLSMPDGIQYLMAQAPLVQQAAKVFAGLHRACADEDWPSRSMNTADLTHDMLPFG